MHANNSDYAVKRIAVRGFTYLLIAGLLYIGCLGPIAFLNEKL